MVNVSQLDTPSSTHPAEQNAVTEVDTPKLRTNWATDTNDSSYKITIDSPQPDENWDTDPVGLDTTGRFIAFPPEEVQRRQLLWQMQEQARETAFRARVQRTKPIMLNSDQLVSGLVTKLEKYRGVEPQVVVDCEGFPKSYEDRWDLDVLELYVASEDQLYFVDLTNLGDKAFRIRAQGSSFTLADYLASAEHKKLAWDCRADAYCLHFFYNIRLAGIIDTSLAFTRGKMIDGPNERHRWSLLNAIESGLLHRGRICQAEFDHLATAHRQRRALMVERPWSVRFPTDNHLPEAILQQYAADVRLIYVLYSEYVEPRITSNNLWDDIALATQYDLDWVQSDRHSHRAPDREAGDDAAKTPWNYSHQNLTAAEIGLRQDLYQENVLKRNAARAREVSRRSKSVDHHPQNLRQIMR